MRYKSLVANNDEHLIDYSQYFSVVGEDLKIKDYIYIDYEVVFGGAVFFFIPYDLWFFGTYESSTDLLPIVVEFELQEFQGELIDSVSSYFDFDKALRDAERRAIEYLINK